MKLLRTAIVLTFALFAVSACSNSDQAPTIDTQTLPDYSDWDKEEEFIPVVLNGESLLLLYRDYSLNEPYKVSGVYMIYNEDGGEFFAMWVYYDLPQAFVSFFKYDNDQWEFVREFGAGNSLFAVEVLEFIKDEYGLEIIQ